MGMDMKAIEYTTNMPDDGVFSLPPDILKGIKKNTKVKILLLFEEESEHRDIGRFCGQWQDERNVHEVVKELYEDRKQNIRSEGSEL
jgi:hypothetical protein